MRADRLVALLLLLQQRGSLTAAEAAAELEVSVRTARRDLEALGMAGLPVYSTPGRNGGWRLVGDGTTDLTGLSVDEAVAVFEAVGAVPTTTSELASRDAMRKLASALPEPIREPAERAAKSFRVLPSRRARTLGGPESKTVTAIRASIMQGVKAELDYRDRHGVASTRVVDPWGLVVNDADWYLIAGTTKGRRSFRVDRILEYTPLEARVEVPADFDLDAEWGEVEAAIGELRYASFADVMIHRDYLSRAAFVLGRRLRFEDDEAPHVEQPDTGEGDGVPAKVGAWSIEELSAVLAGLHPGVTVVGPLQLRNRLAELGRSLADEHGAANCPALSGD